MGMFDSILDPAGVEWQTKAFDCTLAVWRTGSALPGPVFDYQVKILGEPEPHQFTHAFATVRNGVIATIPDVRVESLPLLDYMGGWLAGGH